MSKGRVSLNTPGVLNRRRLSAAAAVIAAMMSLAACGSSSNSTSSSKEAGTSSSGSSASTGGSKLMILEFSFPCGLNETIAKACAGAKAAAKALPPGYKLQIKTGVDIADNTAFNNLIQTSLQLHPGAVMVFPAGPAAQTPILNRACDQGVKVVILGSPAKGVKCQSTLVGQDDAEAGALVGRWLVKHPTKSKEVGIVTQPPGEFTSTDNRVKGFTQAVEAGGYKVVATAITDLTLDKTRTEVTNMLTAHPNIGAIFSANGPMGQGTSQALRKKPGIVHVTLDFDSTNVKPLLNGSLGAVTDSHAYDFGKLAVETTVKVLQDKQVPPKVNTPLSVVDKTNVKQVASSQQ